MLIKPDVEYLGVSETKPLSLILTRAGKSSLVWAITGISKIDPQKRVRAAAFRSMGNGEPSTFWLDNGSDAPALRASECLIELDLTERVTLHSGSHQMKRPMNAILLDGKRRILAVYLSEGDAIGEARGLDLSTGVIEPLPTENYIAIATKFRVAMADGNTVIDVRPAPATKPVPA